MATRSMNSEDIADEPSEPRRGMFIDEEHMKEKVLTQILDEPYRTEDQYWEHGYFQKIAKNQTFDLITLGLICCNAIWIGHDADANKADTLPEAKAYIQIVEHIFCLYFTAELIIRFMAFQKKLDAVLDAQFVFDFLLVSLMIFETWVIYAIAYFSTSPSGGGGGGGASGAGAISLLRMLRLTRICRLVRLLRAIPELMVLIKGIIAAFPSVAWTLAFLVIIIYVFAVAFKILSTGTALETTPFRNIPNGMAYVLLAGMLPDNQAGVELMAQEGMGFAVLFMVFIILASITIMNMLVGVLVEVVGVVSKVEKEQLNSQYVKDELKWVFETQLDTDSSGTLCRDEIGLLLQNEKAVKVINRVGVDVNGLVEIAEFHLFNGKDEISFTDLLQLVLQLRGSQEVCVRDVVNLRKFVKEELDKAKTEIVEAVTGRPYVKTPSLRSASGFH